MKKEIVLVFTFFGMLFNGFSQTNTTEINLVDSGFIEVIQVLPDSFPSVDVVLRVSDSQGNPVWELDTVDFTVNENNNQKEIISLTQISLNKSIQICLVLDHSGSMRFDNSQLFDQSGNPKFTLDYFGNIKYPRGYKEPIEILKKDVVKFIQSFDASKDSIALVSFSDYVDKVRERTNDASRIAKDIKGLEAEGATAFFDALSRGIDELKLGTGIKMIVALTDGLDNRSKNSIEDVILKAQLYQIPLHIIGLGSVNQDTLQDIADETGGVFYYSRSALGLSKVYEDVQRNIQSVYSLTYTTDNFSPSDTSRKLIITYSTDSTYAQMGSDLVLSDEVISYLEQRKNTRILYSAIGVGIAIGIGAVLLLYRRNSKQNIA